MKKPRERARGVNRRTVGHHGPGNVNNAPLPVNTPGKRLTAAHQRGKATGQQHGILHGWKAIAGFLALPVATAQRWGKSGMPVHREGRFTVADVDELRAWLGRESQMPAPAHIATNRADLAAGLRESISAVRRRWHDH